MPNIPFKNFSKYLSFLKYAFIIFSILFVVFLIVDKIVLPIYVRLGDEIIVPDVTRLNYMQAVENLEPLGFKVDYSEKKYDPYHPQGVVLSQYPIPFTRVKRGRLIRLTVSLGERKVKVPELIGNSPRDAELKLLENNLKLGDTNYQYSSSFPEGTVIFQIYEPGLEVKKGTEVGITVSLGEEPQEVVMPKLINKTMPAARDLIKKSGLVIGRIDYQVNNDYLPNTVLFQFPSSGEVVSPGFRVLLIVSKLDSTTYMQKYRRIPR